VKNSTIFRAAATSIVLWGGTFVCCLLRGRSGRTIYVEVLSQAAMLFVLMKHAVNYMLERRDRFGFDPFI